MKDAHHSFPEPDIMQLFYPTDSVKLKDIQFAIIKHRKAAKLRGKNLQMLKRVI